MPGTISKSLLTTTTTDMFYYYFEHVNIRFRGLWMFGNIIMTETLYYHPDPRYIVAVGCSLMMLPYCLFVIMDMEFFLHLDNKKYKMFVFPLNILQFRLFNETHCLPIILSYFLSYFLKSMSSRGKSLWSDLPSHHTPIESGMFIVCILRRSAAPNTKVTQLFLCSQAGPGRTRLWAGY